MCRWLHSCSADLVCARTVRTVLTTHPVYSDLRAMGEEEVSHLTFGCMKLPQAAVINAPWMAGGWQSEPAEDTAIVQHIFCDPHLVTRQV